MVMRGQKLYGPSMWSARMVGLSGHYTIHHGFMAFSVGAHSWVRKTLDIEMEGEQTGT